MSRTLPASPGQVGRGQRVRSVGTRRRLAPARSEDGCGRGSHDRG